MKKVLIIEDNIAIRENTAELLELNNFKVLTAETGREGYESAKKYLPDVIIYNAMMTNGENFLNLAKNEMIVKDIPLIYFAGGSLPRGFQNGAGNAVYLEKPFTEEKLVQVVKKALDNYRA